MTEAFSLDIHPRRLNVASDDSVTAVAAAGNLLWVGTNLGRVIRYNAVTYDICEVRGRTGQGRLTSPVWRIFADPFSKSALIILSNADSYFASSSGDVRPRWLSKLRGMRCVAATWVRIPSAGDKSSNGSNASLKSDNQNAAAASVLALLGTAFGSVFAVNLDTKYERNDQVRKVWAAPSGEGIVGIRIERVAGSYVGTVATETYLYMLYGAQTLEELFASEEGDAVHRIAESSTASSFERPKPSFESPIPSELQFMSGMARGGFVSRRFVWAARGGIMHAQLALRSRRTKCNDVPSSITASVTEKSVIGWNTLKEKSGSAVPMACNLSTFHVMVLYPGSVYAYNHISGELTQIIEVWSPDGHSVPGEATFNYLESPAVGFARDTLVDSLWVFTMDGQLARIVANEEEQKEAWRAAKSVGRFDLAMALAPFVNSALGDTDDFAKSREAVFEAQADHAAANGDWDSAARLSAKTNRAIETVLTDILESCARDGSDRVSAVKLDNIPSKSGNAALRDDKFRRGHHSRAEANCHNTCANPEDGRELKEPLQNGEDMVASRQPPYDAVDVSQFSSYNGHASSLLIIIYLVCKLDSIPDSRPSQRTIIATLLVQLYASCISRMRSTSRLSMLQLQELQDDFCLFLADHVKDLHLPTALAILTSNRCYENARELAILSGDFTRAIDLSLLHLGPSKVFDLLSTPQLRDKDSEVSDILHRVTPSLAGLAPQDLADAWESAVRRETFVLDHCLLLGKLAGVARSRLHSQAEAAYNAAVGYVRGVVLCEDINALRKYKFLEKSTGRGSAETLSNEWHDSVRLLFALHADCGTAEEADASYDALLCILDLDKTEKTRCTLGDILNSGFHGSFWRLIVKVYGAIDLHEDAVSYALKHGGSDGFEVAVTHVLNHASVIADEMRIRKLWLEIAGSTDNPLGVAERSNGALCVDDVLPLMADFTRAEANVRSAIATSLAGHQNAASAAADDAQYTLEQIAAMRADIAAANAWHRTSAAPPCGHKIDSSEPGECPWCGRSAIDSLDKPLL